jgi:hypothetical protein
MIIIGIVLLILAWLVVDAGVPVPPFVPTLLNDGGWILIVIGVILLILNLVGRPVGGGWGPSVRGRRYWW